MTLTWYRRNSWKWVITIVHINMTVWIFLNNILFFSSRITVSCWHTNKHKVKTRHVTHGRIWKPIMSLIVESGKSLRFLLTIVLSVFLRFTDSDYHFGIFKFLEQTWTYKSVIEMRYNTYVRWMKDMYNTIYIKILCFSTSKLIAQRTKVR
jgi:hypothetical protein